MSSADIPVDRTAMSTRPGYIRRFTVSDRLEHATQMISFIILAVTGLPQKWATGWFSEGVIDLFGGIESTRNIHRVAATVLMIATVFHFLKAGYYKFVENRGRAMIPGREDLNAARDHLLYNIGRRDEPPKEGRFTFAEKAEYWSLVWGTVLMIVTGYMLWNPIATASFLPGQFIPAAKAAHGGEALLAVLAIIVWHMYHVHFRSFNKSIFTGLLSREEMEHEHALELEDIDAGRAGPGATPEEIAYRRPGYLMIAGGVGCLLLAGIYYFVTFEQTAITTIEPIEQVEIFTPLPPPTEPPVTTAAPTTTLPAGDATRDGAVAGLLGPKCGACHSSANSLGGLDLSTYEAALAGGNAGPGFVPGDADASQVLVVQIAGGHPGQLSDDEIALLEDWVAAGAPEN